MLEVKNISLSFGAVQALHDISFGVDQGEILAIIGPNGAGKSSMLNVINGFYTPDSGTILFKGVSRAKMEPAEVARAGVARTFQNIALFRGMTTLDNIMTGRNTKMSKNFLWQALHFGPARNEELEHRDIALDEGAKDTPLYEPMRFAIKKGAKLAIWLSERI